MKIKLRLDDPHTRAVWEAIERAHEEVASWPAWKRGEYPENATTGPVRPVGTEPTKR
ncbi:MAG TPA: hypothetical protein VHW23_27110 [Kofleriaceae bacterium]|jgi:hypothetical protein|nr:hypothetical protein [Kofleriaceae bacterium]